jgi:hypothetical protein
LRRVLAQPPRCSPRASSARSLLEAGIDVISTVNIGQLDSLADVVEKITGAAPRQAVPDPVVRAACEVELVDLTPEALCDRMARGHIYPVREAEAALSGWFRIGNLSMLCELALLWLAAKLASDPQRYRPGGHDPGSGHPWERVVVALSASPGGRAADPPGPAGQPSPTATCSPPINSWPSRPAAPTTSSPTMTSRQRCWRSRTQRTQLSWCSVRPRPPGSLRCGPERASDRG